MWGTPVSAITSYLPTRFIPTHVGNTGSANLLRTTRSVHPHACGEHASTLVPVQYRAGSSPRMWGTRSPGSLFAASSRFIPTHVGNTCQGPGNCRSRPVHPHACGEHGTQSPSSQFRSGSSPRMWGTRNVCAGLSDWRRFIPTHVGNTGLESRMSGQKLVHPHACGEHTYRTELFLKKKKHLEKSTASSSIPWSDPEAGMPPIAARRTTLDVDG